MASPQGKVASIFKTKTRDEWCEIMEHTDICFAPVLNWSEAPHHPHNTERSTFIDIEGITQPAPAPRFSGTVPTIDGLPAHDGQHTVEVLTDWGIPQERIEAVVESGAARQA